MPLPVDSITPEDSIDIIRRKRDDSIQQCIGEGKDPKQCAAIVHSIIRKNWGKEIPAQT